MKKWIWLLGALPMVAFMLQACSPQPKGQPDCGFVQNVYGERVAWKKGLPITLYIHESVPQTAYTAIENAVKDWEVAMGRPMFRVGGYGIKSSATPQQDGVNMIYWMPTWEVEKASEQARTSVYWISNEIKETDIRVNATNFSFFTDTPTSSRDVHLESLILHELGHVLGLKHEDHSNSVMATYLAYQAKRTDISARDKDSIRCEYL